MAASLSCCCERAIGQAVEEVARIVAQIRRRWPDVRILLRADSGFVREELMAWCEANGVHFLFGLQQNKRLIAAIAGVLTRAEAKSRQTGKPIGLPTGSRGSIVSFRVARTISIPRSRYG
jgi:Transposase DDE domain group 1